MVPEYKLFFLLIDEGFSPALGEKKLEVDIKIPVFCCLYLCSHFKNVLCRIAYWLQEKDFMVNTFKKYRVK